MSAMEYAKQKTFEALLPLVGNAPIRKRLGWAGLPLTVLRSTPHDSLTPTVAKRLDAILAKLTQDRTTDVERGAEALSDDEAVAIAREILSLQIDVMGGL